MCDDMDFDVSSDVSDSGFDSVDDVSSDFNDVSIDYDDAASENFNFDDISDDSLSFDDSFEMEDVSDDLDYDLSDDIETLDFNNEFDNSEVIETLDFDDDIETLELDDLTGNVETLEFDDSSENIDTLEFDDSVEDISENFDDFDSSEGTEELDSDDINFVLDEVETLSLNDELSEESIDNTFDEIEALEETSSEIEDLDIDMELENDILEPDNKDSEYYEATPISEIPIVQEDGSVDTLENIINENNEMEYDRFSDIEPYEATPISEIPIIQEDGFVDTLENIMNENSDAGHTEYSEIEPYEATPIAEMPISMESIEASEEIDETENILSETEFEGFNDEVLEQALLDNAVDNVPLTEAVYEDDSEYIDESNAENDIYHMTEEELDQFVNWELQHENGNYAVIEDIMNDESLTDDQKEFMTQQLLDEIKEAENEVPEYGQRVKGLTYDGRDIITRPEEIDDVVEFNGELTESDYEAIYDGLESYDFHGVDCLEDVERLDSSLENFTYDNWEQLTLDEQKEQMIDLADYFVDITGLENPPQIEFYNNEVEGDYGGFNRFTNTLSINEYMLYQNDEAADTIAHEMWHAYQHQRSLNPKTKLDAMYGVNYNDYITYQEDVEGYRSQILESEARAFAQQIKDRLHSYK